MTMVIRWVVLVVVAGLFGCNGEENADPPEAPIECNTSTWPGPLVPGPSSANLGTRVTYLCVGEDDCRVSNTSGTTCSEDAGVTLIGYTSSGEPSDWWVTLADISAEGWAVTVGEETTDFVDSVREFGEFSVASISNLPSDSEVQLRLLRESDGARFHVYFGITGDWSDIHTEPTPDDLELTMRNFVVVEDVGVEYPALVTTTLDVDCELAMDDDGLYWLSHHSTDGSAARNWTLQANPVLHHTPALVGKTDVVTTLWTDTKTTRKFTSGIPQLAIATDDTHVYWTAVEDETVGVVWKADKATGDVTEVARDDSSDDATQPLDLEVNANAVYWADGWTGEIVRHDKASAETAVVATVTAPSSLELTDEHMVIVSRAAYSIFTADLNGESLQEVHSWWQERATLDCATGAAVAGDGTFYFGCKEGGVGRIMSLDPKTGDVESVVESFPVRPQRMAYTTDRLVFFGDDKETKNHVVRVDLTNGHINSIAADQPYLCGLAAHDGAAAWTRHRPGDVWHRKL